MPTNFFIFLSGDLVARGSSEVVTGVLAAALFGSIIEILQSFGTSPGWLFLKLLLKFVPAGEGPRPSGVGVDYCFAGILSVSVLRRAHAICNGVIFASLRFFRRILWMFLPTGVALSKFDFIEASVIVLVDRELGNVPPCFGLIGMLATVFTICFFYRLEGRNMLPNF